MSLRDRLRKEGNGIAGRLRQRARNPFPASNQTTDNPHCVLDESAEEEVENQIVSFFQDGKSRAVVLEGTQGVGKTSLLNHIEKEIRDVLSERDDFYVVRYLPDPEASFDGTTRRLFEELGTDLLRRLADRLRDDHSVIERARSHDMRAAIHRMRKSAHSDSWDETEALMMEWLRGSRLLKRHREALGVQFRLDTVESKIGALRDLVQVSAAADALGGIFLLLDELEKQDGVLGPTAVVRYLSAVRAVVDALPERLFLMAAMTPDALIRYSAALPALSGRLQNRIELKALTSFEDAWKLARFYMDTARAELAGRSSTADRDVADILQQQEVRESYGKLRQEATRRGDAGVRHREFLHTLHLRAEKRLQAV